VGLFGSITGSRLDLFIIPGSVKLVIKRRASVVTIRTERMIRYTGDASFHRGTILSHLSIEMSKKSQPNNHITQCDQNTYICTHTYMHMPRDTQVRCERNRRERGRGVCIVHGRMCTCVGRCVWTMALCYLNV
jgi:hypothetical protein